MPTKARKRQRRSECTKNPLHPGGLSRRVKSGMVDFRSTTRAKVKEKGPPSPAALPLARPDRSRCPHRSVVDRDGEVALIGAFLGRRRNGHRPAEREGRAG